MSVSLLGGELLPCDATATNGRENGGKPTEVGQVAHVVGEHSFVQVAEEMERLNAHVCAMQTPLEQAPEVLNAIRADPTVDVLDGVVDGLVGNSPRPE
jgi:hypothetical protein